AFAVVSLAYLDPVLRFFGASDNSLPYARDYMRVLLYGNVLTHLYLGLNDVVRSSGYPGKAMAATLTAVGVNVLFDYVFISVFGLGIKGAALATLLAQFVAFMVVLRHLTDPRSFLRFKRGIFAWRPRIVRSILGVGLSPFFTNACACLVVLLINNSLVSYGGDNYLGACGIVNRVSVIFVMVAQGICQGMQPIAGFNYGAGDYGRVLRVYRYAVVGGMSVMALGFLIAEICPGAVSAMFTSDPGLAAVSNHALRIVLAAFGIVGFQIVTAGLMMAMRKAGQAIVMSLSRQLLCLAPLILILPSYFGVDGVWYAMPLSDAFATLVAVVVSYRHVRMLRRGSEGGPESRRV
ncbi:MATE family efflux transporter, partial [Salmonella enterica]|nr:MATE family efflux transporter [Salmonella enterica]